MTKCEWKPGGSVVEIRSVPSLWRMAICAICGGERGPCNRVDWIVRLFPRRQMAAGVSAICRRNLQIVVIVNVARAARNVCVAICKQEAGRRVIKLRV